VELARIYGNGDAGGSIRGSFLALPRDVRYRSERTLIQDFALLDDAMIEGHGSDNYPWADYSCVGKAYVPENMPMRISYTSEIATDDIEALDDPAEPIESSEMWSPSGTVEGGTVQFELRERVSDNDRWVPLGTIEALNVDTSGEDFETKWHSAGKGDNDPVGATCER